MISAFLLVLAACHPKEDPRALARGIVDAVVRGNGGQIATHVACAPDPTPEAVLSAFSSPDLFPCDRANIVVTLNSSDEPEAAVTCSDGKRLAFVFRIVTGGCGRENRGLSLSSLVVQSGGATKAVFYEGAGKPVTGKGEK